LAWRLLLSLHVIWQEGIEGGIFYAIFSHKSLSLFLLTTSLYLPFISVISFSFYCSFSLNLNDSLLYLYFSYSFLSVFLFLFSICPSFFSLSLLPPSFSSRTHYLCSHLLHTPFRADERATLTLFFCKSRNCNGVMPYKRSKLARKISFFALARLTNTLTCV
jgi:hypothetical protein